jgi:hypothetical protein
MDAAYASDPALKQYYEDLTHLRSKVFQNGDSKNQ